MKTLTKNKNLIFNAFAYIENTKGAVNINENNDTKVIEIYMKLCVASLVSAKKNNADSDVALVTNYVIPEKYITIFKKHEIKIINIKFDNFVFDKNMKWNLAFFKLCALDYVVKNLKYENYLLLDTDTYTQNNLNDLFLESSKKILLYNMQHAISISQAINMNDEYKKLYNEQVYMTNYGGEFICGNRKNLSIFLNECNRVYKKMIKENFQTKHGDEFIICCSALKLPELIKDGAPYIYRYWTGSFYLVSTNYKYNPISILHLPAEKNYGLIWIADYIIKNGKLPNKKKLWKKIGLPKAIRPFSLRYYFAMLKILLKRRFKL